MAKVKYLNMSEAEFSDLSSEDKNTVLNYLEEKIEEFSENGNDKMFNICSDTYEDFWDILQDELDTEIGYNKIEEVDYE